MLSDRVATWLGEISRDTIVASHGGVSRVLRGLILRLANADVAALEVPQDKVLVLSAGSARWL
jgi:probable phosphoglycerate mutase